MPPPLPSLQLQEEDEIKMVNIVVSDMRATTWCRIPEAERRQDNVLIKKINITAPGAYQTLRSLIQEILKVSPHFIICRVDQDVEINEDNIISLRDNDHLFLVDFLKQDLPFTFSQVVNTTPHTNTITDQDGTYHGDSEQNAAAFALADLIDNSLSATSNNADQRIIEIRFYDNGNNSSLHILDNGHGMHSDELRAGLKYKAPKDSRRQTARDFIPNDSVSLNSDPPEDDTYPMYINSNISKFGAGMKQAVFYLGEEVLICSKRSTSKNVSEVFISANDLERLEQQSAGGVDAWDLPLVARMPGTKEILDENLEAKLLRALVDEEKAKSNFTHIVVSKIKASRNNEVSRLELLRRKEKDFKGASLEKQLAHIYHYYIHGRDCYDGDEDSSPCPSPSKSPRPRKRPALNERLVEIFVSRYQGEREPVRRNLRTLSGDSENLEHKLIKSAADSFKFCIEISQYNRVGKSFKVGGEIRYHPYKFDRETHPCGLVTRKGDTSNFIEDIDEDIENNGSQDGFEDSQDLSPAPTSSRTTSSSRVAGPRQCSSDFFHVWWNGRLIPNSKWESFDWCSPPTKLRLNDPLRKCYDRVSGSLFFDKNVDSITCTKLEITQIPLDLFKEQKIGGQMATFQRIEIGPNGIAKASRMAKTAQAYEAWIKNCHMKYDKQVTYSTCIGTQMLRLEENKKAKEYDSFEKAAWDVTFKTGDAIKLIGRKRAKVIGKVVCFYVESGGENVVAKGSITSAPLAFVKIQQLPEAIFASEEDSIVIENMSYIDKTFSSEEVQKMIREREKDLELKLVLSDWIGPKLIDGAEIPIDSLLIKCVKVEIVRKHDDGVVSGTLFHPQGDRAGKKILLYARVYPVDEYGAYTPCENVYYTSAPCELVNSSQHGKGYFFKNLDLKTLNVSKPGNYTIVFSAYVDLVEHPNHKQISSGRPTTSTAVAVRSTSVASLPTLRAGSSRPDTGNSPAALPAPRSSSRLVVPSTNSVAPQPQQDFDDLGRHILRVGSKRIPLPVHRINFTSVAGGPDKVKIEEIGEDAETKIGQPFEVRISFLDRTTNATQLLDLGGIIPNDKPLISVIPSRVKADAPFSLEFTHLPPRLGENCVIIPHVIASGSLDGLPVRDCKMIVNVNVSAKKLISSAPEKFRVAVGTPRHLKVQETRITVENGTCPALTCNVFDSSENLIPKTEQFKPILLNCDIYHGKTVKSGKLYADLKLLAATTTSDPQKLSDPATPINLEKLKTRELEEAELLCKIKYEEFKIETSAILYVFPSKRPEKLRIFYRNMGGIITEIEPGARMTRQVNEHLGNLSYVVSDGTGNPVEFEANKHEFKFEWPSVVQVGKATKFDFGELPKMDIPSRAFAEREITTSFVTINCDNPIHITHTFLLTTIALDASELQATGQNHELGERIDVPVDDSLKEDVILTLTDDYGNVITELGEEYTTEDIDLMDMGGLELEYTRLPFQELGASTDSAQKRRPPGSFVIRNFKFISPPPLGEREIDVWMGPTMKTVLKINVVPGKPAGMAFEIDNQVLQRNSLMVLPNMSSAKVRVVLVDSCRNPVPGVRQCWITLEKYRKMIPEKIPKVLANKDGIADFKVLVIGMKTEELSTPCRVATGTCVNKCYNTNHITAKAEWADGTIAIARCGFHILSRPGIPRKLNVSSGEFEQFCYQAGGNFNALTAFLEAEDGSAIGVLGDALTKNLILSLKSQDNVFEISPANVQEGCFTFGGVPGKAGSYSMKFTYDDGTTRFEQELDGEDGTLRIIANSVACLEPEDSDSSRTVFVSNDPNDRARRCVTTNLKLFLKDEHKNLATEYLMPDEIEQLRAEINGNVHVSLQGSKQSAIFFENPDILTNPLPLENGIVNVPDIVLLPTTNLPNNSKYTVKFRAVLDDNTIHNFSLDFIFFNDISQQKERQDLENQRTTVGSKIKSFQVELERYNQELARLKNEELQLKNSEEIQRKRTQKMNTSIRDIKEITIRENLLAARQKQLERDRRENGCNVDRFQHPEADDIVGPGGIGHLAQIKCEEAAEHSRASQLNLQRVISWHLQRYLPVFAVRNEKQGHVLRRKYEKLEFMLADILRLDNLDTDEIPPRLRKFGNPAYVRKLLQFTATNPEDVQLSHKVFNKIVGRMVLVNTLEDATQFLANYNKLFSTQCPTILTRDGNRLSNDAIIGGNRNKAPALASLKYKFGLAQTNEMQTNDLEIKQLTTLKAMVKDTEASTKIVQEYIDNNRPKISKLNVELALLTKQEKAILRNLEKLSEQESQQQQHSTPTGSVSSQAGTPVVARPNTSTTPATVATAVLRSNENEIGLRSSERIRKTKPFFDESPAKKARKS